MNLVLNRATVEADESIADELLERAVLAAGYGTTGIDIVDDDHPSQHPSRDHSSHGLEHTQIARKQWLRSLYLSAPFTVVVMALSMTTMFDGSLSPLPLSTMNVVLLILSLPVVYAGRVFYTSALRAARHGSATMDTLVSLGAGSAFLYSVAMTFAPYILPHEAVHTGAYYDTTCTIITLIIVGKFLESNATARAADALRQLLELQPQVATVVRNDQEEEVQTTSLVVGDIILVKPGERIPTDAEIMAGSSSVDESMITGEPIPRDVVKGAMVTGGTVNTTGALTLRATAVGSRTVLAGIIRAVEKAQESKAPVQRLADTISSVFVPVVLVISLASFIVWMIAGPDEQHFLFAVNAAITVLIIACPCALGLATPTAIVVGSGTAAQRGVLFANAESIERLSTCNTIILDKTGTITQGRPFVVRSTFLPTSINDKGTELHEPAVWAMVAALEARSEHPVAKAIVQHVESMHLNIPTVMDATALPGLGMTGSVDGYKLRIGNEVMMTESLLIVPSTVHAEQGSLVYAAVNGRIVLVIEIADRIRESSAQAIAILQRQGKHVVMLTGDKEDVAHAIARQAGINDVIANVRPEQKAQAIKVRQGAGARVAMVGDGINDAPALAQADVGIAIGSGTDVAKTTAGVTLMRSDLTSLIDALHASTATMKVVRQNLFLAFVYNILAIPIATGILYPVTGWLLSPMVAAGAMAMSSVTVVFNALRLKRII